MHVPTFRRRQCLRLTEPVQLLGDARQRHPGHDLGLTLEPVDTGGIGSHLRREDLEGDEAIERRLARLVDGAHAPLADEAHHLVPLAQHLADERVRHRCSPVSL